MNPSLSNDICASSICSASSDRPPSALGPPSFERRRVLMDAVAALAPGSGLIAAACTALGLSRASLHRRQAFRISRLRLCARGQRRCGACRERAPSRTRPVEGAAVC